MTRRHWPVAGRPSRTFRKIVTLGHVISGQARFGTAQLHYFKLLYRQFARKVGTSTNSALIRTIYSVLNCLGRLATASERTASIYIIQIRCVHACVRVCVHECVRVPAHACVRACVCVCAYVWGGIWGGLGGKKSQIWERFQTTGPILTICGTRMQIHLGMDV